MALILRSTIPTALVVISQKSIKSSQLPTIRELVNINIYETCCSHILESCENKPFIENTLTHDGHLVYTSRNINDIIEKMQTEYQLSHSNANTTTSGIECCNECGNC